MSHREGQSTDASPDAPASRAERLTRLASLSPRRREVLDQLARGLTNKQMAATLGISPATVRTHITAVLAHLGLRNRTEAAALLLARPNSAALPEIATFLANPAIAVLPTTTGEGAELASLATAITQELCAMLSRWCWFPVIARSSTLQARDLGLNARELGAALDARFLVDPSLRATPRGWRLSVEVVDTLDGCTLWSERFDFFGAPFDALDALVAEVVACAYPVMAAHMAATSDRTPHPADPTAWQLAHRAVDQQAQRDRAGNVSARDLCRQALERDRSLTLAHFTLGLCAYDAVLNQWGSVHDGRDQLLASADACLKLAPHAGEGYFLFGRYHLSSGDFLSAIDVLETAVTRNPSFAAAHALLAQAHMVCGQADIALARMQHALRLGPRSFVAGLATLQFAAGRFAEATAGAEQAIALAPAYPFARALAAASAFHGGELERAREHLRFLRQAFPSFDAKGFLATFGADVPTVARLRAAIDALTRAD